MAQSELAVTNFWEWFAGHAASFARFTANDALDESALQELLRRLQQIDKRLAFEFGTDDDNQRLLVVTANGDVEAFPAVERVASAAPALPDWEVIAFRPPQDLENLAVQLDDTLIAAEHIYFVPYHDEDRLGLELYVLAEADVPAEAAEQAAFTLVDAALGEYEAAMGLGFVEVQVAKEPPVDALPLTELPFIFEDFHDEDGDDEDEDDDGDDNKGNA
ncbi:MAG TPA: hypothetical protein VEH84_01975 [Alphaproteobacteria bacterium]|nr:hypothetical protein [Alphaproteobacteria bacterium]